MFTWISRTCAACVLLSLAACFAPTHVTVGAGDVTVVGPEGYCIDQAATRRGASGDTVLLAACNALSRGQDHEGPEATAILTVSIGPPGSGPPVAGNMRMLERFVRGPAGRAALSQSGQGEAVSILSVRREADALFVRLRDSAIPATSGVLYDYWRVLFELDGRIVTASVFSGDAAPIDPDTGLYLARRFVARLRAANSTR